jgi:hypothetical protein
MAESNFTINFSNFSQAVKDLISSIPTDILRAIEIVALILACFLIIYLIIMLIKGWISAKNKYDEASIAGNIAEINRKMDILIKNTSFDREVKEEKEVKEKKRKK